MTYTIKCITGIHSRGDFEIRGGQEKEVSKEIYDYFNNRFGASGNFNFITKGTAKKAAPKEDVKKAESEVEVTEEVTEVKATRRSKK